MMCQWHDEQIDRVSCWSEVNPFRSFSVRIVAPKMFAWEGAREEAFIFREDYVFQDYARKLAPTKMNRLGFFLLLQRRAEAQSSIAN